VSRPTPAEPVLIVDDEEEIRGSVRAALMLDGFTNFVECADGDQARDRVHERSFAAVVLDLGMPGLSGVDLLTYILEERPETPVIVATGTGDLDTAVRCMKAGAFDYLSKPIDRTRLVTSTRHAIEKWETAREVRSLRDGLLASQPAHPEAFREIITSDAGMLVMFRYAEAIAPTSLPVLITGETGVGKELVARAIHSISQRTGNFVPVNVAGLDDTLFADALFGHVKGAYTGAESARDGMVAKAEEGTLFLDEIGDLAPQSQIKLLRLLQEREYYPLGTDRPRPTTARFVFATNLDIARETGEGRFRKDLLYRLRSHHIRLPPLRERAGDLPALVDHFFVKACKAVGKSQPTIPKELLPLLRSYAFPGNIRELEGLIFDAVVRHQSRVLSLASFRSAIGHEAEASPEKGSCTDKEENIYRGCETLPRLKEAGSLLIEEALRRSGGNQDAAARMVGLTRTALNRRLNRKP
jgi:two-component system nitrogen regulation response regulator GlnG